MGAPPSPAASRIWIKHPLAILAEGAENGLVIAGNTIVELVPRGAAPATRCDDAFDASSHVVLPGLVNTHHHFYQTLTRAHPAAIDKSLFPWLQALYPIWARLTPETFRIAARLALVELLMSGCTTAADHHYICAGSLTRCIDIEVEEAHALGMRLTATRGSMNLTQKTAVCRPTNWPKTKMTCLSTASAC